MATQTSIFIPSSVEDKNGTVSATSASAEIVYAPNTIVAVVADGDLNIAFGSSGMAAPTAANFKIGAGVTAVYDLGDHQDRFRIYNPGGSTLTYWIQRLERS